MDSSHFWSFLVGGSAGATVLALLATSIAIYNTDWYHGTDYLLAVEIDGRITCEVPLARSNSGDLPDLVRDEAFKRCITAYEAYKTLNGVK